MDVINYGLGMDALVIRRPGQKILHRFQAPDKPGAK